MGSRAGTLAAGRARPVIAALGAVLGLGLAAIPVAAIPVAANAAVSGPASSAAAGAAAAGQATTSAGQRGAAAPGPTPRDAHHACAARQAGSDAARRRRGGRQDRGDHRDRARRGQPADRWRMRDRHRLVRQRHRDGCAWRHVRAGGPRARRLRAGVPGLRHCWPVSASLVGRGGLAQRGRARAGGGEPGPPRSGRNTEVIAPGERALGDSSIPAGGRRQ